DPPAGTLPTDTTYFELIDAITPYIGFDQGCRHTIGFVHGVYPTDPSLNGACNHFGLHFRPSEKGVHVLGGCWDAGGTPAATVFVWYALPVSQFTMTPYISGKTYSRGTLVFYPATGNCHRALAESTSVLPSDTDFWAVEPMPDIFAQYVKNGAYADCLKETFTDGDEQIRLARAQLAANEADSQIQGEIDLLLAQGQKHFYGHGNRWGCYGGARISEPWGGDRVYALTDVCETDSEFVAPPSPPGAGYIYRPDIVALRAVTATPALDQIPTVDMALKTVVKIVIDPSYPGTEYENQEYRLMAGASDGDDPGQVAPLDYVLATNNKHWERID
ncbi:MAG TPA: hypothetical protein VGM62_03610, partial [Chthoniobacterales bacterium]